ncbi:MAG: sigma-54 dependent transcriptional regulator [Pseudoruegeria sp.]
MTDRILLVDDDAAIREALGQTLELSDLQPTLVGSFIEAKDHIAVDFEGIILSDIRMPGKDGFAVLAHVQSVDPELPVILLTGEGDIPMAVRGMSEGAFGFLEKPCDSKDLLAVIHRAIATRKLVLENRKLRQRLHNGDAAARMLFGESPQADDLRVRVRRVASVGAEVLITGEAGAGTSKVAEVIHLVSDLAAQPFRKFSAASMSPQALRVLMREEGGGSVFFDEIAALPPETQFTLLEELDRPEAPRLLAGTYRTLESEVADGQFNPDLFYKLDVMRVRIPSLRERPEDIPVLFRHYVNIACEQAALPPPDITPEVLSRLMAQDWPGNARALMNAAMRFAMGLGEEVEVQEQGLSERMAKVERSFLVDALRREHGNASGAAKALKLPRKTFYDKLTRHNIRPEDYR